ncbi:Dyp-type peroxidase [Endozoicomonas arenosclerae]|uniref:Dyp-type peroxidase n=1 Tax=Endozoicomonas arenosclerae TaxID=1633495 RepID=UPI00078259F1|nr:Dyp-type peroxidase [Endozoicomonas arenosclerae]
MSTPQSGITPEANTDACFLVLNIKQDADSLDQIKKTCALIPRLTRDLNEQYPDARLSSTISMGSKAWDALYNTSKPALLAPFKAVAEGNRLAPATPGDLLLHIRSNRKDINFILLHRTMDHFGQAVEVQEDETGFRYLDSRDLTGFVDGTENPQGDNRASVTLVGDEDNSFSGGCYIHTQKWVHKFNQWNNLAVADQEKVIGRTKEDDIEFSGEEKAPTAHVKRSNVKNSEGKSMEILRHSMPYGNASEGGLYFVSYCRTPVHFDKMLESMIKADSHGHYDHLMNYSQAVTGCAFFAPSVEFLESNS